MFALEISENLNKLGIKHIIEANIFNIFVDFLI